MSTRPLLDEMFGPRIATALVARGHDCLAVAADPLARQSSDADPLLAALEDRRAVVTDNVVDSERLRRHGLEHDDAAADLRLATRLSRPGRCRR